jgi:Protein of unknown function (DUF2612)
MSDTGPPYPPPPTWSPLSNAIGQFQIGISPVGTIIPFNYWDTIISQYANSPIITTLIGDFSQWIDQTENFDDLYDLIWNVVTAQGYGLDVWGRIVGVTRTVSITSEEFLGFEEQEDTTFPFGQGIFYSGTNATTNFALSDAAFRQLIYAKALANISNGSIPAINMILQTLFPGYGNAYVVDGLNMTMEYVFTFNTSPVQQAILTQTGVLPKPCGVSATFVFL